MKKHYSWLIYSWKVVMIHGMMILVVFYLLSGVFAQTEENTTANVVVNQARAAWMDGSPDRALDILDQGIQEFPGFSLLQQLRGDILTTIRRNSEALEAYELVQHGKPESLGVRWAKWSVLTRVGEGDLAIVELQRIAQTDTNNPLVHLRLAQELRKLDRLEESVESYPSGPIGSGITRMAFILGSFAI